MTNTTLMTPDDAFVLGNLCLLAVLRGHGEAAQPILRAIQTERPRNAGGFLMQAMHLCAQEKTAEALEFIESSPIYEAETNRDEARAFHVVLLNAEGWFDRARELGESLLADPEFTSESAHHAVRTILNDLRAAEGMPAASLN